MNKIRISYADFQAAMTRLTEQLLDAHKKKPWKYVIGIPTGGLPAAVHVAKHLRLPLIASMRANDHPQTEMNTVLFVDDFFDTGSTVAAIMEDNNHETYKKYHITNRNFAFAFARRQKRKKDCFIPRFFGHEILPTEGWAQFPWEPPTP